MGLPNKSLIQWTDYTWNYIWGCTKVSPGCDRCYAERFTKRLGRDFSEIRLIPNNLNKPLKVKEPSRFFVNGFSDFFHHEVTDEMRGKMVDVMNGAPQHVYQILTKRPGPMRRWLEQFKSEDVPSNWWFGVSVESEKYLWRIYELRQTNCKTRFVSIEPLLESIDRRELAKALGPNYNYPDNEIDWTIVGGESDFSKPRPCDPNWIRAIRDVCGGEFGFRIPFYLKQLGGRSHCECHGAYGCCVLDGKVHHEFPNVEVVNN